MITLLERSMSLIPTLPIILVYEVQTKWNYGEYIFAAIFSYFQLLLFLPFFF